MNDKTMTITSEEADSLIEKIEGLQRENERLRIEKQSLDKWSRLPNPEVFSLAPVFGNFSDIELDAYCAGFRRCAELAARTTAENIPDLFRKLIEFYGVDNYDHLIKKLIRHVALLQDAAKRNVKPWEDTFPPTLLPSYIKRILEEDAAATATQEVQS